MSNSIPLSTTSPAPLAATPTGIFPAWIPANEFVPDTPRVVICTDLEGIFTGVFEGPEELGREWNDASTSEPFDSVITHWMESPPPPEN